VGGDEGDPALWLRLLRGETLTSPLPFFLAPPKAEGGRIMVTGTGSPSKEVAEGHALLRWQEAPPPTQHKFANLLEKVDFLSEAPWCVSFEEELLIRMTSRSNRGY